MKVRAQQLSVASIPQPRPHPPASWSDPEVIIVVAERTHITGDADKSGDDPSVQLQGSAGDTKAHLFLMIKNPGGRGSNPSSSTNLLCYL